MNLIHHESKIQERHLDDIAIVNWLSTYVAPLAVSEEVKRSNVVGEQDVEHGRYNVMLRLMRSRLREMTGNDAAREHVNYFSIKYCEGVGGKWKMFSNAVLPTSMYYREIVIEEDMLAIQFKLTMAS